VKETFLHTLEGHFHKNLEGVTPLQRAIREKSWSHFLHLGLPEKKSLGYQYFPFSQFYQESFDLGEVPHLSKEQFQTSIYPECRNSHIIFVNGQFVPELSDTSGLPSQVVVMRLKDALNHYGSFLQGRLSRAIKDETDPFATLNISLIQMGLFLYVPPKVKVEQPIQCLHVISQDKPVLISPRIHFFLGSQSQMQWTYDQICLKDFETFSNAVVDIALEEGATFEQYGLLNPCDHGWHLESTRVTQKRNSHFTSITMTSGSKSVRQDFRIQLLGENASCDLKGIAALSENKQSHVHVLMDHQEPHCHSMQLFKNVLTDAARASFEGKIYVRREAQKTEAYQLNNNLLLSDKAIANCKPNLEIFADDVKASHGATISQVDPDHLFYMKTRGVLPKTAKKFLISGFSKEIVKEVSFDPLRKKMENLLEKVLK